MIDFWQEMWDFSRPDELLSDYFNIYGSMCEAKDAILKNIDKEDTYEYLCVICRNIANKLKTRLPDNLHNRIVLGIQNAYTKDYINKWGV